MDKQNNEKTSFWGRPVKDEKGHVVAYKDEFGDVRTPKRILQEVSSCLLVLIGVATLIGGCSLRVHEEIQKRREKKMNKPAAEKVEKAAVPLNAVKSFER